MVRKGVGALTQITGVWNNWAITPWCLEENGLRIPDLPSVRFCQISMCLLPSPLQGAFSVGNLVQSLLPHSPPIPRVAILSPSESQEGSLKLGRGRVPERGAGAASVLLGFQENGPACPTETQVHKTGAPPPITKVHKTDTESILMLATLRGPSCHSLVSSAKDVWGVGRCSRGLPHPPCDSFGSQHTIRKQSGDKRGAGSSFPTQRPQGPREAVHGHRANRGQTLSYLTPFPSDTTRLPLNLFPSSATLQSGLIKRKLENTSCGKSQLSLSILRVEAQEQL